jgi:hypothetical protein
VSQGGQHVREQGGSWLLIEHAMTICTAAEAESAADAAHLRRPGSIAPLSLGVARSIAISFPFSTCVWLITSSTATQGRAEGDGASAVRRLIEAPGPANNKYLQKQAHAKMLQACCRLEQMGRSRQPGP